MTVTAVPLTASLLSTLPSARIDPRTHCVEGSLPESFMLNEASYVAGLASNMPSFSPVREKARVGIFDVTDADSGARRAFLLFLPGAGGETVDQIMYGILPPLFQNGPYWRRLNAHLPVADATIRDVLSQVGLNDSRPGMVKAHFAQQVMSNSRRRTALVIPVRSLQASREAGLGPFAADGAVVMGALSAIEQATGGALAPRTVDAFAHSGGGPDLARLLAGMRRGGTAVRNAVAIDPQPPERPTGQAGAAKLYVSPWVAGAVRHEAGRVFTAGGGEYVGFGRWQNEPTRARVFQAVFHGDPNRYLHDWAYPRYLLRLGIQTA